MDRGKKLAEGFFLISAGVIWLFLVIIWLPPFMMVFVFIGIKIGLPNSFYGAWLLWVDVTMALCVIAYGVYRVLHFRHAISN